MIDPDVDRAIAEYRSAWAVLNELITRIQNDYHDLMRYAGDDMSAVGGWQMELANFLQFVRVHIDPISTRAAERLAGDKTIRGLSLGAAEALAIVPFLKSEAGRTQLLKRLAVGAGAGGAGAAGSPTPGPQSPPRSTGGGATPPESPEASAGNVTRSELLGYGPQASRGRQSPSRGPSADADSSEATPTPGEPKRASEEYQPPERRPNYSNLSILEERYRRTLIAATVSRWARWSLGLIGGTPSGPWNMTFRILASANRA